MQKVESNVGFMTKYFKLSRGVRQMLASSEAIWTSTTKRACFQNVCPQLPKAIETDCFLQVSQHLPLQAEIAKRDLFNQIGPHLLQQVKTDCFKWCR